jgi:ADP-heptose:LPS heptosyltransferase
MKYAMGGKGPIGALKYDIVPITRGKVLEIGRGPFKVWPHFVALRERSDQTMPPDIAADRWCDTFAEGLADFQDGAFDAVVVHPGIDVRSTPLVGEIVRVLREGGHLLQVIDGALLDEQLESDILLPVDRGTSDTKTACVVRYGAIGDVLQSAAIIATLRDEGYHVTFMCEPRGEELLRHDPNVDAFWVQDKDQVPNQELPAYWEHVAQRFDRFINLSETVEGTLLAMPGRANFGFPQAVRHELCDRNYAEFMAAVAELPFKPELHFVPTAEEKQRAADALGDIAEAANPDWVMGAKWHKPFTILWVLSGSAMHKVYPHQDAVIARILAEIPNAHVITVGDDFARVLEAGWEEEERVHRRCGELSVRDTLALAQLVDLVIGPETGVLNGVAFEQNHKIVLLSHSSEENLTKHWVNTEALHTQVTPCYPCHRLHMVADKFKHCAEHKESGTAMCQWELPPSDVWTAVQRAYVAATSVRRLLETA